MESFAHAAALFAKGGFVMYPLVICSIIVVAIVAERCFCLRAADTDTAALLPALVHKIEENDWNGAVLLCSGAQGAVAAMLAQGMTGTGHARQQLEQSFEGAAARHVARLRYRLNFLDTIVTLAPLLGLLGTVTGMIQSFSVLNLKAGQPLAITGGVGEALVATATGLCVAIVALVGHSYLTYRIENIVTDMEDAANSVLTAAMQGDLHEAQ